MSCLLTLLYLHSSLSDPIPTDPVPIPEPLPRPQPMPDPPPDEEPIKIVASNARICEDTRLLTMSRYRESKL